MRRSRSKSNAQAIMVDGHRYASKLEVLYAAHLAGLKKVNVISNWVPHPCRMPLIVNGTRVGYYTPDFEVFGPDGTSWLVDTKGFIGREWPFREKVIRACYPTLDLRIVKMEDF